MVHKKLKNFKKVVDKYSNIRYTNLRCDGQAQMCGCSSMVEHQPSKLDTWVRFPSPAFVVQTALLRVSSSVG